MSETYKLYVDRTAYNGIPPKTEEVVGPSNLDVEKSQKYISGTPVF